MEAEVSKLCHLTDAGGILTGTCPFCHGRGQTLNVGPRPGMYHCYSCNRGGEVIRFVQDAEDVDFDVAVQRLATRAGLTPWGRNGRRTLNRHSGQHHQIGPASRRPMGPARTVGCRCRRPARVALAFGWQHCPRRVLELMQVGRSRARAILLRCCCLRVLPCLRSLRNGSVTVTAGAGLG